MDGEDKFVKIYAVDNVESSGVEVLLNHDELKILVNALLEFESKIERYKQDNANKKNLGYTHMHFRDYIYKGEKIETDIVFYVNLNEND